MDAQKIGEIIATQKAMKEQLDKVEKSVKEVSNAVAALNTRFALGRGVIMGLSAVSGCIGAIITAIITKGGP